MIDGLGMLIGASFEVSKDLLAWAVFELAVVCLRVYQWYDRSLFGKNVKILHPLRGGESCQFCLSISKVFLGSHDHMYLDR